MERATQLTKLNKINITESVHKDEVIVTADMFSSSVESNSLPGLKLWPPVNIKVTTE